MIDVELIFHEAGAPFHQDAEVSVMGINQRRHELWCEIRTCLREDTGSTW